MNKLGFGFLRLPEKGSSYDYPAIHEMTDTFLRGGGRYFDTCPTYLEGDSEFAIGSCVSARHPRESFSLINKLPGYNCRSKKAAERYFQESLARCGVEYFDVYLLHWLNRENYTIAQQLDQFGFLRRMKAEGKAARIGFSFHASSALLEEILDAHPEVDVVLLQINYLDWESAGIESRLCCEACLRRGKAIFAMEPVRGGTLAALPEEAEAILRAARPDLTPADWALRFVQSLPGVELCLSGMNAQAQVEANIREFSPLTEDEIACLWAVRDIITRNTAVPCTACGYCKEHCPQGIDIPRLFSLYNEQYRYPKAGWKVAPAFHSLTPGAAACTACSS